MKQLVFIEKGRDGKDKIFTNDKNGKILFPYKDLEVEFDTITVIDDFKVEFEKETYGFFSGRKVDVCLPELEDLAGCIQDIIDPADLEMYISRRHIYTAGSFYMFISKDTNILVTQEVDSGEMIIVKEPRVCEKTRSGKNPRYYSIYNGMTSIGENHISEWMFIFRISLLVDTPLTKPEKASLILAANRELFVGMHYAYAYYDKCVVRYEGGNSKSFSVYYIRYDGQQSSIGITHSTLFDLISKKIITIANPDDYKEAVDSCFDEGFGKVSMYHYLNEAKKIYESITGRPMEIPNMFGSIMGYTAMRIFVLNIDMYDTIKSTHSEEELEKLAKVSKDAIREINSDIKILSKNMSKESLSEIARLNYKPAITIAI